MSNFSDRNKNLEKIISEFQKEDNINKLTKQTLFDHLNNVAMSSNNNTQSARVNAGCNTIENQLGKQHITKLFKNLQEAEAEECCVLTLSMSMYSTSINFFLSNSAKAC